MKKMVTVTMVAAAILVVGCSEQSNAPKKVQDDSQKPKTVVVDKGMSKEEEEKLNQCIAELEEKVDDQSAEQSTQDTESTEDTATASASANANRNTKHVKIVVSSNKPAAVSIYDDSLNWMVNGMVNEEIVGTETYERDIPENSGLSVSAITDAYRAQTTIQVYEDGSLVAQDSDSHGNALITY